MPSMQVTREWQDAVDILGLSPGQYQTEFHGPASCFSLCEKNKTAAPSNDESAMVRFNRDRNPRVEAPVTIRVANQTRWWVRTDGESRLVMEEI